MFERVQFSLRGYQLYTRIEWHIFWYTPYFVRRNESFWNYLTASREIQWVLNQRRSSMSDSTLDDIIFLKNLTLNAKKVSKMTMITFLTYCPVDKIHFFRFSFVFRRKKASDFSFFEKTEFPVKMQTLLPSKWECVLSAAASIENVYRHAAQGWN